MPAHGSLSISFCSTAQAVNAFKVANLKILAFNVEALLQPPSNPGLIHLRERQGTDQPSDVLELWLAPGLRAGGRALERRRGQEFRDCFADRPGSAVRGHSGDRLPHVLAPQRRPIARLKLGTARVPVHRQFDLAEPLAADAIAMAAEMVDKV